MSSQQRSKLRSLKNSEDLDNRGNAMLHQQNDFFIRANKSISETSGSSLEKSQSSLEDPMLDPDTYVGY